MSLQDKNQLVAIDSGSLKIKARWPVDPAGAPTALAMDVQHHRLFSAGRNPQVMVVLDSDSGKILQSFPISAGVDAAAFDPGNRADFRFDAGGHGPHIPRRLSREIQRSRNH